QSEESLAVFNSLTDKKGLPLIDEIISTDTIASSTNRVSVSEVIVEFLREHLVSAEALDGIDTPSITLILPYRLAGAGDVVFMVNTAQKLKQIYPSLPIKVIYLKNDDYLFLGKIKLVSGFEGQRNIQRLGGVTYINARDSRDRMEEFTGAKDLVMLYAVYPDEYSGSDSYFFETIGLKRAVKITMHELGRELPWRDPNKSGHYLLGCNKDALGMPPVAPNFESYVKYCDAKGREGVYLERRKILGKIPGYSVLNVSETIRSDWGFIYGHLPYEVEMYFKAFDRARREDQDFAARPATIFVNRSQGDNKLREEVFKAAEAGDYSVLEYSHERGRLETVLSGGSNVRIVINTVVPRKLFGQLFTLSNDLPSVVTGQDNLSNILFLNAQTKGRVFFWEVLVFQALAEFDLKRAAEKILSGEEYSVFKEALKRGRDINYDFLYKFFSEHDKYRRIYHKLGEGIGREFSFARRINAVIEDWNEKINPKTYPARLAGELIDPIAGQLDNLKLYFENEEVFFVDQTLTGKIADTETTPGKISVLKSLASRAPPFNAVDPESQSFQVLINDIIRHETTELKTGSHQLACQASYVYFQARHKELSLLLEAAKQFRVDLDDDYLGGEEFNWRKNLFNSDTLNFTAYILAALREGIKIVNKMQDGNITAVAVERHGSLATNTWMLGSDIDGPVFYSDGYIPEASRKLLIYLLKSSGVMGFDKGVLSDDSIEWIVSPGVNAAGINTDKIIIYENGELIQPVGRNPENPKFNLRQRLFKMWEEELPEEEKDFIKRLHEIHVSAAVDHAFTRLTIDENELDGYLNLLILLQEKGLVQLIDQDYVVLNWAGKSRGCIRLVVAGPRQGERDGEDAVCRNTYELSISEETQRQANEEFGGDIVIQMRGFALRSPDASCDSYSEVLRRASKMLGKYLGCLKQVPACWRIVITKDAGLTRYCVAACDIDKKTVYLHPYFFHISSADLAEEGLALEGLQLKILYHELLAHISKGIRDEDEAKKDTLMALKTFEAVKDIVDWKSLNRGNLNERSFCHPFMTSLQEKAQDIYSKYELFLLPVMYRLIYINAVFDRQNYPKVCVAITSLLRRIYNDNAELTPQRYYFLAGVLSDIEAQYSISDNRNIRFSMMLILDLWEPQKRILEQLYIVQQIDAELEA
ncbi:MAG: hypothetical protein PHX28_05585, partial [Candidatus Omnitrophica bacterium]|nr:hypothetical protein [Candidatus Omnitrophota bacterium]